MDALYVDEEGNPVSDYSPDKYDIVSQPLYVDEEGNPVSDYSPDKYDIVSYGEDDRGFFRKYIGNPLLSTSLGLLDIPKSISSNIQTIEETAGPDMLFPIRRASEAYRGGKGLINSLFGTELEEEEGFGKDIVQLIKGIQAPIENVVNENVVPGSVEDYLARQFPRILGSLSGPAKFGKIFGKPGFAGALGLQSQGLTTEDFRDLGATSEEAAFGAAPSSAALAAVAPFEFGLLQKIGNPFLRAGTLGAVNTAAGLPITGLREYGRSIATDEPFSKERFLEEAEYGAPIDFLTGVGMSALGKRHPLENLPPLDTEGVRAELEKATSAASPKSSLASPTLLDTPINDPFAGLPDIQKILLGAEGPLPRSNSLIEPGTAFTPRSQEHQTNLQQQFQEALFGIPPDAISPLVDPAALSTAPIGRDILPGTGYTKIDPYFRALRQNQLLNTGYPKLEKSSLPSDFPIVSESINLPANPIGEIIPGEAYTPRQPPMHNIVDDMVGEQALEKAKAKRESKGTTSVTFIDRLRKQGEAGVLRNPFYNDEIETKFIEEEYASFRPKVLSPEQEKLQAVIKAQGGYIDEKQLNALSKNVEDVSGPQTTANEQASKVIGNAKSVFGTTVVERELQLAKRTEEQAKTDPSIIPYKPKYTPIFKVLRENEKTTHSLLRQFGEELTPLRVLPKNSQDRVNQALRLGAFESSRTGSNVNEVVFKRLNLLPEELSAARAVRNFFDTTAKDVIINAYRKAGVSQKKIDQVMLEWKSGEYLPANRKGKFNLTYFDKRTGKLAFYDQYETEAQRAQARTLLAKEGLFEGDPNFEGKTGLSPKYAHDLYHGFDPLTSALLKSADDEVFSQYEGDISVPQKELPTNLPIPEFRSHLLKSNNIAGLNIKDINSVYDYAASLARWAPRMVARSQTAQLIKGMDPVQDKVMRDFASDRVNRFFNDTSPFYQKVRKFNNAMFLVASPKSALANTLSIITTSYPVLVADVGALQATKAWSKGAALTPQYWLYKSKFAPEATKKAVFKKHEELFTYLDKLQSEGRLGHLQQADLEAVGNSRFAKTIKGAKDWYDHGMLLMSTSEAVTRTHAAIAAYEAGKTKFKGDTQQAIQHAERLEPDMQPLLTKANLPSMMQGLGIPVFQYRGWMGAWLRSIRNMAGQDKKLFQGALASLAAWSIPLGLTGNVGAKLLFSWLRNEGEDPNAVIMDQLDKIGLTDFLQSNLNIQPSTVETLALRGALAGAGPAVADITGLEGARDISADLSGSAGLGSLGQEFTSNSWVEAVAALTGAPGGILKKIDRARELAAEGKYGRAAESLAPVAISNFLIGKRLMDDEALVTASGRRIMDEPVTNTQAIKRMFGIIPSEFSKAYDEEQSKAALRQDVSQFMKGKADKWAEYFVQDAIQTKKDGIERNRSGEYYIELVQEASKADTPLEEKRIPDVDALLTALMERMSKMGADYSFIQQLPKEARPRGIQIIEKHKRTTPRRN